MKWFKRQAKLFGALGDIIAAIQLWPEVRLRLREFREDQPVKDFVEVLDSLRNRFG